MKNLNITTGADYKVTHKLTKAIQFMNAQELATFVFKNDYKKYDIENTEKRLIDMIPAWVLYTSFILLTVASVLLHIQLNY
tara:strand:+ start:357 stop:599 length:243 start_codon:yes stop_codon:yes gene_type:complete